MIFPARRRGWPVGLRWLPKRRRPSSPRARGRPERRRFAWHSTLCSSSSRGFDSRSRSRREREIGLASAARLSSSRRLAPRSQPPAPARLTGAAAAHRRWHRGSARPRHDRPCPPRAGSRPRSPHIPRGVSVFLSGTSRAFIRTVRCSMSPSNLKGAEIGLLVSGNHVDDLEQGAARAACLTSGSCHRRQRVRNECHQRAIGDQ